MIQSPRFRSIRWRISIPFILLIFIAMLATGWYLSHFIEQYYLNSLEETLTEEANLLADILVPIVNDPLRPEDQLDVYSKRWAGLLDARVTIVAPDGTVIGESDEDRLSMENHAKRPEIYQAFIENIGTSVRTSVTVHTRMMYIASAIKDGQANLAVVRIAVPVTSIEQTVAHLKWTVFILTLSVTIVAVILSGLFTRVATRPLLELTKAVHELSAGNLQTNLVSRTNDEVAQLTKAFNIMANKVQSQLRALQQESQKLNTILQEMTDAVLIVNADGRVEMMNQAAERVFMKTKEKALGRTLAEVVRHYQIIEIWQRSRETGEDQVITIELTDQRLSLQAIATSLGDTLPGSSLLVFQDMTRIRMLETVRRDFISNISHELRTPLASLKALTETLQDSALEDPPAARRFLQRIEGEVDSLSLMVSELLELSRIESGKVPLQFTTVSPHVIIASAIERLRLQAERAGLAIEQQLPDELPQVLADQARIEQVVVNLLHNAIKFTPSGGQIQINAALGTEDSQSRQVVFSIRDTGVGVAEEDLPRIFERFYKADRARAGGGTGLGLAISRHLVEAHGGKIWATSKLREGSTFYFSLPIAP
jgi:two-component system, OmpR family, phosphate regulon sensor histidine kinase PhoR